MNYGVLFSRRFIDSQESNETAAGLMNLHNNEAGRRVGICKLFSNEKQHERFLRNELKNVM